MFCINNEAKCFLELDMHTAVIKILYEEIGRGSETNPSAVQLQTQLEVSLTYY